MPRDDAARLRDIREACDRIGRAVDASLVWRAATVSVPNLLSRLEQLGS
jgi:uncharacterized protein with HEPN domain